MQGNTQRNDHFPCQRVYSQEIPAEFNRQLKEVQDPRQMKCNTCSGIILLTKSGELIQRMAKEIEGDSRMPKQKDPKSSINSAKPQNPCFSPPFKQNRFY